MATYEQRKQRLASKIIARRHAIALQSSRRQAWLDDLLDMHSGTGGDAPRLLATMDYQFSYLYLDPDFSSIASARRHYWQDLYNRYNPNGTPLRNMTQADLKRIVPRTLHNLYIQDARFRLTGDRTRLTNFINQQLQSVNASNLAQQDKATQTARLQQQQQCLTASTIPRPPAQNNAGKIKNPNYDFFSALSDQYLFNNRCPLSDNDPFWVATDQSPNGQATISADFGPSHYVSGLFNAPIVPSKRLQLCFVANDSSTYSIDRIYLIERILLHSVRQGGRPVANPWLQLAQNAPLRRICQYSSTYGVLGYCHLSWSDSAFDFN
ncbi:hypothetical protein [Marinobacter mobilis]|uniref:hypothetical protein n=1 Tax=Marinobacter mobilis TaxID=488533 RepID=UPI0035C7119E